MPLAPLFKNADALPDKKDDDPAAKDIHQQPVAAQTVGFEDWWRAFGNRELEGLVNRGLANNPDVRIATIRLVQAKARADQAAAGLLPSLSAPAVVARQAPGGTVGSVPVNSASRAPQNSIQGGVRGDFRVDVWGEQSALAESANLQLWRAVYERDNTQRNVVANIVSGYVDYVALNDRLRVARETERVLSATLQTMERRLALGDATVGDFEQQRAQVFGWRATIPGLEQQQEDALNSLAFLVGSVPGSLTLSEQGLDALGVPAVLPGLPSALLLRRPDVRMAEARLLAADADIDVARARILPPLDLSAQAGYSSNLLSQFFLPKRFFWSTIASVTASIFDAGKREGEKKYNEAVYEEMVETYVRVIYQAMREVEGALATIRLAGKRLDAQKEAAEAARRAWEINTKVYAMGGADHLTLLESERTFHRYLDEFQRSRMEHYRAYAALFMALGGGVKPGAALPGTGQRPGGPLSGRLDLPVAAVNPPTPAISVDGLDWDVGGVNQASAGGTFWQIELPGLYHRNTVGAAWRDLRARYPALMEGRMVRPRLNGKIEDGADAQEAWYRLLIARFKTPAEAQSFCNLMQANQDRCRVVSANGDVLPVPAASPEVPLAAADAGETAPAAGGTLPEPADASPERAATVPALAALPDAEVGRESLAHTIQLGAFSNLENAAIASAVWQFRGYEVYVAETRAQDGRLWYAVRTGIYRQRRAGENAAQQIRRKEDAPALLVPTMLNAAGQPARVEAEVLTPNGRAEPAVLPEPPEAPAPLPVPATPGDGGAPVPDGVHRAAQHPVQHYAVQVGAFFSLENAQVSQQFWQGRGLNVYVAPLRDASGRPWYAVRTGYFLQRKKASALALQLGRKESAAAIVVTATVDAAEKPEMLALSAPGLAPPLPEVTPEARPEPGATVIPAGGPDKAPPYTIQLGVFASIDNAAKAFVDWRARGYEPYVCDVATVSGLPRFAVRTGEFANKREAQAMVRIIERQEARRGLVVPAMIDAGGAPSRIDVSPFLESADLVLPEEMTANDVR